MVQAVLGSMTEDPQEQIQAVKAHFANLRGRMILIHEQGDMTQVIIEDEDLMQDEWW